MSTELEQATAARKLFIGGAFVASGADATREIINPATGHTIAVVPEATAGDVDDAVRAANEALKGPWSQMPAVARGMALQRLAGLVRAHADELARIESENVGKPIKEATFIDIPATAFTLEYYGGWADKVYGETIPIAMLPVLNYTLREPVGVVAAIVPWNFPLAIAVWKLAPALAAGCPVVLKPSELTPLSALRLAELVVEAEFPPGAVNVVTGGSEVGEALVAHPDVHKIAFTGSTATGRRVMSVASHTLKKVTLECGGKSPNIVFADADLERAADATLFGIFANQGEVCAAGSRLFVEKSIHREFVGTLAERAKKLSVGDPSKMSTDLGPLISRQQLEKVDRLVRSGVAAGADPIAGGGPAMADGFGSLFYEPTIFDNVTPSMEIAREEIFGPVLSVLTFETEDEAVALANDTIYGLVANVHTNDLRRAHAVSARLQCGSVFVNLPPIPFAESPIGGYKQTGIGKDLGFAALAEYMTTKSVLVSLSEPGQHFRWFGPMPDSPEA